MQPCSIWPWPLSRAVVLSGLGDRVSEKSLDVGWQAWFVGLHGK
jgi:hypothetical protein